MKIKSDLIIGELKLSVPESKLACDDWLDILSDDDLEDLQSLLMLQFEKIKITPSVSAKSYVLRFLSKLDSIFLEWLDTHPYQLFDYIGLLRSNKDNKEIWYWTEAHKKLWRFRKYSESDVIPIHIAIIPFVSKSSNDFIKQYDNIIDKIISDAKNNDSKKSHLIDYIKSSRNYLGNEIIFNKELIFLENNEKCKLKYKQPAANPSDLSIDSEVFFDWQLSNSYTEERELIIGLDFGTSCTKAIIRDNSLQTAYAVPFKKLNENRDLYILLTKLFITKKQFSLRPGVAGAPINDIKDNLINNPNSVIFDKKLTSLQACVAYIALVLREIRHWFFIVHCDKYKNSKILWELNIGMPSTHYNDDLHETFKLIALAGWNVSTQCKPIHLDTIRKVLKKCYNDLNLLKQKKSINCENNEIHPDNINAFPEVIAEILGYSKSPLRKEGLYLIIDVGAGTVDIASFILYPHSNTDSYNILEAEVIPFGVIMLHKNRLNNIKNIVKNKFDYLNYSVDGVNPLPQINDYLPSDKELNIDSIDNRFIKNIEDSIRNIVVKTKKRRDPNSSNWNDGLPVFLCGGGARVEVYKEAIIASSNSLNKNVHISQFDLKTIPIPEGLCAPELLLENYHRIAVAYGLSYTVDDIGRIVEPNQIKNISNNLTTKDYTENYIGSELI
jgi:hypothetical protein